MEKDDMIEKIKETGRFTASGQWNASFQEGQYINAWFATRVFKMETKEIKVAQNSFQQLGFHGVL